MTRDIVSLVTSALRVCGSVRARRAACRQDLSTEGRLALKPAHGRPRQSEKKKGARRSPRDPSRARWQTPASVHGWRRYAEPSQRVTSLPGAGAARKQEQQTHHRWSLLARCLLACLQRHGLHCPWLRHVFHRPRDKQPGRVSAHHKRLQSGYLSLGTSEPAALL